MDYDEFMIGLEEYGCYYCNHFPCTAKSNKCLGFSPNWCLILNNIDLFHITMADQGGESDG